MSVIEVPEKVFIIAFQLPSTHPFHRTLKSFMCKRTPFGGLKKESTLLFHRRSASGEGRHAPLNRRSVKKSLFGNAIGLTTQQAKLRG
jgi:hypothetical protein